MSFFFSPFIFLFQLIAFLLQAAFIYGLGLIATVALIAYAITTLEPRYETVVKTVTVVEMHEVTKFVEKGPELTCTRLSGCKTFPNAKTEEEYCPSCVMK